MSIFGESDEDKRDYGFAFGAFKGTLYLGLVMAMRGHLSPLDAREFRQQLLDGIGIVPPSQLSPAGYKVLEEALDEVERQAAVNFRQGS